MPLYEKHVLHRMLTNLVVNYFQILYLRGQEQLGINVHRIRHSCELLSNLVPSWSRTTAW